MTLMKIDGVEYEIDLLDRNHYINALSSSTSYNKIGYKLTISYLQDLDGYKLLNILSNMNNITFNLEIDGFDRKSIMKYYDCYVHNIQFDANSVITVDIESSIFEMNYTDYKMNRRDKLIDSILSETYDSNNNIK